LWGWINLLFSDNSSKYVFKPNNFSWNEVADVLYVDQPIRTGFSLAAEGSNQVRNENTIGDHFRKFLLSFLQIFPEYSGTLIDSLIIDFPTD
jgi:carboxypeptidase C (cathepsin A)